MNNIIAIVGRPNVGKSSLFNRLTGRRDAIVDAVSGVTRDRHYGNVLWNGCTFTIADTGGYGTGSGDIFEKEICAQVDKAVKECSSIIFMVDVTTGKTGLDAGVADMVRRSGKKVFLAVNKVDNNSRENDSATFYSLGFGDPYTISSLSGRGTGELLDDIVKHIGVTNAENDVAQLPRIAIVGRPNVGKSSLVNAYLGEERTIVSPVPGTTRDATDARMNAFGCDVILVDTAGIRKKSKVKGDIEFYSVRRAIDAIERCDVCMIMIDATEGMQAQDVNILRVAAHNHKGVIIVVNKWDLLPKEKNITQSFTKHIHQKTSPFIDIPVVFVSVLEKQRLLKALEAAIKVHENKKRRIATSVLNKVMQGFIQSYPPFSSSGKAIKIKYLTQLPVHYPAFVFFSNLPKEVATSYKRYLENKLRENFELSGASVELFFRQK